VTSRSAFVERLFRWHSSHARVLEIRSAATPWEVLVAEVMSQQTGIERVGPAWRRFVDTWPTPVALAEAGTHDLLAAWAGLGYNRRALALRDAATRIVEDHGGLVPTTVAGLDALPGIGPYTARAVAASAFGVPVAPLDVNVRRVTSRVLGVAAFEADLQRQADDLVARRRARRWLDAVMDLAVAVCTPRSPRCDACPLAAVCASRNVPPTLAPTRRGISFVRTTRWLRGQLLAMARAADRGAWVPLPSELGLHGTRAVAEAAARLEREGFVEIRDDRVRIRP
jgi:A/G-specific adenine glycosylase